MHVVRCTSTCTDAYIQVSLLWEAATSSQTSLFSIAFSSVFIIAMRRISFSFSFTLSVKFSTAHTPARTMSEAFAYENGKPTVGGPDATIIKCFKDNGNGLLFRITDEEEKIWAFYNDTANYHMIVKANFGKDSEIEAAGKTSMERDADSGEYKCELTIAPMETEMFIKGTPNGFKICYEANPNVGKA